MKSSKRSWRSSGAAAIAAPFVFAFAFAACAGGSKDLNAPFPTAFGLESVNSMSVMHGYDLRKGYPKDLPLVRLTVPGTSVNPWRFMHGGDFYVMVPKDEGGGEEDFTQIIGEVAYETVTLTDPEEGETTMTMMMYKPTGKGGEWAAVSRISSLVLSVPALGESDAPVSASEIGEVEYRDVAFQTGETRTVLAVRLSGKDAPWIVEQGGALYSLDEKNALKPVGFVDERLIVTQDSKRIVLLMTKGLAPGAKWVGMHDGTVYIDPL
jgi:hypothetical protein